MKVKFSYILIFVAISFGYYLYHSIAKSSEIDYSTQIKPILNTNCIACHGGVKKQAGFSLLFEEEAKGNTKSGKPAIVPFHPEKSSFISRLTAHDLEERMPYQKAPLKKEDIELLTKWVKQGAKWGEHWAFQPLKAVDVPSKNMFASFLSWFGSKDWAKNDIDLFVKETLEENDLSPSKEAEKAILLRRVSFDITGLPPSESLQKQFLNDNSDNAYSKLVDELLATPAYGEKWAGMWMDLARYSDSKGYERDFYRNIWHYRDWLIKAFNKDIPYNQFITEQLAGDLLPNATDEQLVATAFHRNSMTNDEGGSNNEEFRTVAVLDRVNTNWAVLQSTSFACVQCHSHPYDPIRHDEYYKFMAFFNNTADEDTYEDFPQLKHFDEKYTPKYDSLSKWLNKNIAKNDAKYWQNFVKTWQPAYNFIVSDDHKLASLVDEKWLTIRKNGYARMSNIKLDGQTSMILRQNNNQLGNIMEVRLDKPEGKLLLQTKLDTSKNTISKTYSIPSISGTHDLYFIGKNNKLPFDANIVVLSWLAINNGFPGKEKEGYLTAFKQFNELNDHFDYEEATPIMLELPNYMARKSQVFERGSWLSKGKEVTPDVPAALGKMAKNSPKNRLGLAQWLVDTNNPLTARTAVNRVWEQLFGIGLVETIEDFGTQGFAPSHPELLDWLAMRYMKEMKWSNIALLKEIVMSATYRQSSYAEPALLEKDPANRLLARGPRLRLSAEQIRDQALAISGLLDKKMYGKSVFPYQPEGVWDSPYNSAKWVTSNGTDRFRRSLYTFWKRTSPYPSTNNFDLTSREVCLPRRIRTNTPLQALTTLNDPTFVEASKHLALLQIQRANEPEKQIALAYKQTIGIDISKNKEKILLDLYQQSLREFTAKPKEAMAYLNICSDDNIKPKKIPETAALALVMNALLNLDEVLVKN